MRYDRTVIGYHGCDLDVAERLLAGAPFEKSQNDYDWLGAGVYFWEYGADRALKFAERERDRGRVKEPAVVGALIQLGKCFDLLDTRFTADLADAYVPWAAALAETGKELPKNAGGPDRLFRRLDCALINWYLDFAASSAGKVYDTVRCAFIEGDPLYEGAGIRRENHIQIAVRSKSCIVGVFRPTIDP